MLIENIYILTKTSAKLQPFALTVGLWTLFFALNTVFFDLCKFNIRLFYGFTCFARQSCPLVVHDLLDLSGLCPIMPC